MSLEYEELTPEEEAELMQGWGELSEPHAPSPAYVGEPVDETG